MSFVDISSNNDNSQVTFDMRQYSRYHNWVSIKMTEGPVYVWSQAKELAREAHSNGVHVILYHWLSPGNANVQAQWFLDNALGTLRPGDMTMVDYEWPDLNQVDPAQQVRALNLVNYQQAIMKRLVGIPALVYTNNAYLANKPAMINAVRRYPVVIANYSLNPVQRFLRRVPNPYGLKYWALQYTSSARINAASGPVDLNKWLRNPRGLYHF